MAERSKLRERLTHTSRYLLPPSDLQAALLESIGRDFYPRVESEAPILLTAWEEIDGTQQWHLVNYTDIPQQVTLQLGDLTGAWVYTLGVNEPPNKVIGSAIMLVVDVAKVIRAPQKG
jgi:hypothetical protein